MKVVFVTFADNKFRKSLQRIENEARSFSCFTDFYIFHDEDIDKCFRKVIKPWLYRRGYGYWRWKPYFVKKVLDTLDYGDVLVWADVGCVLNSKAEDVLQDYIDRAKKTKSGLLVFEQKNLEKHWTKGDLLEYLHVEDDVKSSPQLLGGFWVIVKTPPSVSLVGTWYDICRNHGDLVTDKKSLVPNDPEFKEHRHDQSVFSLLAKKTDAIRIPFSNDNDLPILVKRKKEKTILVMITNKILIPWRMALGYYLKYVEGFYFRSRVSW